MIPRHLDIGLEFDTFSVSASVPTAPVVHAFQRLARRNDEARARDDHPELRPFLLIRIQCPACRAPVFRLTSVVREGELLRACRGCRTEFPVGS